MGFTPQISSATASSRPTSFTAMEASQVWNDNLPQGNATGMVSASFLAFVLALVGIGLRDEPGAVATAALPDPVKATLPRSDSIAYQRAKSLLEIFGTARREDEEWLQINYNDGQSPYGFKTNAEIWNGRIAMFSFVWVFMQELLVQKGLIEGIHTGDPYALGALSLFVAMITAFTGMFGMDDSKDFVERVVEKDKLEQNLQRNWQPKTTESLYELLPESCLNNRSSRGSDPPTFDAYMRYRTSVEEQLKMTQALQTMTSETQTDGQPREYQWMSETKAFQSNPETEFTPHQVVRRVCPNRERYPMNAYDTSQWSLELAELWNGRFAQIAFVTAFGQEFIQNKGIIRGLQEYDPINIVALISSLVGMIGISAGFLGGLSVSEGTFTKQKRQQAKSFSSEVVGWKQSAHEISSDLEASIQNFEMTRGTSDKGESQSPSSFPVDGYRFKTSTQDAIGALDTSPHPEGVFHFKTETDRLIKEEGQNFAKRSSPSGDNLSPPATVHPIEGYRFNPENQKMVVSPHPGGVFGFSSSNSLLIKQGAGKPVSIKKVVPPPPDVTPHPVKGFNFGQDTISIIKADTRNRSVPSFQTGSKTETTPTTLEESGTATSGSYLDGLGMSCGDRNKKKESHQLDLNALTSDDKEVSSKENRSIAKEREENDPSIGPTVFTHDDGSEELIEDSFFVETFGDTSTTGPVGTTNASLPNEEEPLTIVRPLKFTTIPLNPDAAQETAICSGLESGEAVTNIVPTVEPIASVEESQLAFDESALGSFEYYNPVGCGSYLDALNRNTAGEDIQPPWVDEQDPVGADQFGSSLPETLATRWEGGNSQWFP